MYACFILALFKRFLSACLVYKSNNLVPSLYTPAAFQVLYSILLLKPVFDHLTILHFSWHHLQILYLASVLCDGPISLVATEEGAAEYGMVSIALR